MHGCIFYSFSVLIQFLQTFFFQNHLHTTVDHLANHHGPQFEKHWSIVYWKKIRMIILSEINSKKHYPNFITNLIFNTFIYNTVYNILLELSMLTLFGPSPTPPKGCYARCSTCHQSPCHACCLLCACKVLLWHLAWTRNTLWAWHKGNLAHSK
jgi:hypothetical protein